MTEETPLQKASRILTEAGNDMQIIIVLRKSETDPNNRTGELMVKGSTHALTEAIKKMIEEDNALYDIVAPAVMSEIIRRSTPLSDLITEKKKEVN